jgi:hypothetical protein
LIESGAASAGIPVRSNAITDKSAVRSLFICGFLGRSGIYNPNILGELRLLLHWYGLTS